MDNNLAVDSGVSSVRPRKSSNSIWNDDRVAARLVELSHTPNAHSSADIARILSGEFGIKVSRNAVIGRCNRTKLPRGQKSLPRRRRKASSKRLTAVLAPQKSFTFHCDPTARTGPSPLPEPVQVPLRRATSNRSIAELQEEDCRYPIGTRLGRFGELIHVFCCQFKKFESPYCPAHAAVVYTPVRCRHD
jgi:hypothetical protein